jgi:hypothetical protein
MCLTFLNRLYNPQSLDLPLQIPYRCSDDIHTAIRLAALPHELPRHPPSRLYLLPSLFLWTPTHSCTTSTPGMNTRNDGPHHPSTGARSGTTSLRYLLAPAHQPQSYLLQPLSPPSSTIPRKLAKHPTPYPTPRNPSTSPVAPVKTKPKCYLDFCTLLVPR